MATDADEARPLRNQSDAALLNARRILREDCEWPELLADVEAELAARLEEARDRQ